MPRATKRHRKKPWRAAAATFDIDTLPGSSNLTAFRGGRGSSGVRPERSSSGGAIRTPAEMALR